MDVNEVEEFTDIIFEVHEHDDLVHQRGGFWADEVAAKDRVVIR